MQALNLTTIAVQIYTGNRLVVELNMCELISCWLIRHIISHVEEAFYQRFRLSEEALSRPRCLYRKLNLSNAHKIQESNARNFKIKKQFLFNSVLTHCCFLTLLRECGCLTIMNSL
jgi:hypothetical protein